MKVHAVGLRRESVPIPPDEAATRFVGAGRLRFGLEYRVVTDAAVRAHYGTDSSAADLLDQASAAADGAELDDEGFSLHVFHGDAEYLRFDDFGESPHYHYITPGSHHVVIAHDEVANGALLGWAIRTLRDRAPAMLRHAGADAAAAAIDEVELSAALDEIEAMWRAEGGS